MNSKQSEYWKQYYQKNKDWILKKNREYIRNHKDKHREYQKRYRETKKGKICQARWKSKSRNLGFNLIADVPDA